MGATNRTSDNKVWYALGTELGEKEGRPLFKQWLKRKPTPPLPDNFEDINGKYYLTFTDIEGTFEAMRVEEKEFTVNGKLEKFVRLWIVMSDKNGVMNIELGNVDGRYSMNFLNRMLNPNLDISKPITISPYKMENDGKLNMGIVVYQGREKIVAANKEDLQAMGCPPAEVSSFKGKEYWDFTPVVRWLYKKVEEKLRASFLGEAPEPELMDEPEPVEDKMEASKKLYGDPDPKKQVKEDDDDGLPF